MKRFMHRSVRRGLPLIALLAAALVTSSCLDGDEPVIIEPVGGDLFERYVAMGNSITAGFQSSGINVQLQQQAYPVLLAEKAGASFGIPALAMPGCPPPLDGPLGQPISAEACALRSPFAPRTVQNLAVPGAKAADATAATGTGSILNTLILGGRTQVGAMLEAEPTLVSVWFGNNDALGAALGGSPLALTPLDAFQAAYDDVVDAVESSGAADAILIGVIDPRFAPGLQPGAYFWAMARNPPPGVPELAVSDNCAPVTGTGEPNPLGARMVSFAGIGQALSEGADPLVIDCVTGVETSRPVDYLLDANEQAAVATRVGEYNAHIASQASARGWIYVDPNASLLGPALADPNKIRKCQLLATATPATFEQALMASCPVDLDPGTPETFFGSYISFDGVHPSAEAHAIVADTLAARLNAKHGLTLPVQ